MAITEAQVRAHLEPEEPDYPAAAALGAEALPVLERLVRDADPLLASKAAYLASLIPDDRADRVLAEAARSEHPTVRVAAAAGLRKRPDPPEDAVIDLMTDRDEGVRKVAMKSTRRLSKSLRDRIAARAETERNPGRRAAMDAVLRQTRDVDQGGDYGGGPLTAPSPETGDAPGEGGGDLGSGSGRRPTLASAEGLEGGGGGDLGGDRGRSAPTTDGPDGGGVIGAETTTVDDGGMHGGGQF